MSSYTPFPPETELPQAQLNVSAQIQASLPVGIELSIPATVNELYTLADEYHNALRYYANNFVSGQYLLIELSDTQSGECFLFDCSVTLDDVLFGTIRHAVGKDNVPAPEHLKRAAENVFRALLNNPPFT